MKEKNILKIKEIESLVAESKATGKFNLEKLISKENNLLDIGKRKKVQIFLGTKEDFEEINQYLLELRNNSNGEEAEHYETLRTVAWHFRQLQEEENQKKTENNNLKKYGLQKVPMPQTAKNSKGEDCDYESRVFLQDFFRTIECYIEDKTELRNIVEKYLVCLPKKQRLVISMCLENKSQKEICHELNKSKSSISNIYNRAIRNLIKLINKN